MKKIFSLSMIFILFPVIGITQDFWQQTNGPYDGAFIISLAIDSNGIIYAGTQTQGIYKSGDDGNNWLKIGLEGETITTIFPYSEKIILVGAEDGFYKTIDGGNIWIKDNIISIVNTIYKTKNNILFLGTNRQIFRSTDEGNNWVDVTTNISNLLVESIAGDSSGKLYVTTDQGIFVSTDDGISWIHKSDIGIPGWKSRTHNIIFVKDSEHIFLYASSNYQGMISSGFYLSTDNGENWILKNSSLKNVSQIAVNQTGELLVSISSDGSTMGGVLYSSDDGSTWNSFQNQTLYYSVNTLITANESYILAGTDYAGFFISKDSGNSWENLNNGINNSDLVEVYTASTGSIFCSRASLYYGNSGVYRSRDEGNSWEKLNTGNPHPNIRAFFSDRNGNLYAGDPGIYRSTNDGDNWQMIKSWEAIDCFAETPKGTLIAGSSNDDGIFRSTDNGFTWIESNSGLSNRTIFTLVVTELGTVLAGSFEGRIFRSTDDGINWQTINTPSNSTVLALFKTKDNIILAGTTSSWSVSSLLRSSDDGITWELDTALVNRNIRDIAENAISEIFVACEFEGVYRSQDKIKTWSLISNEELTDLRVQTISVSTSGYLYAGTWRGSLFRSNQTTTDVANGKKTFPTEFLIKQNYPNSCNPSTTISYQIPRSGYVTLKVYDLLGREVATLVNEEKGVGKYEADFNGNGLASEIYFYRMQAGDYIETKKMILLR